MENQDPRESLTALQWKAVIALSRGEAAMAVADSLGISRNRMKRWFVTPRFRAAVDAERHSPMPVARMLAARLARQEAIDSRADAQRSAMDQSREEFEHGTP
jgi:hypothetical protein